jgi:predicted dehydrogenase
VANREPLRIEAEHFVDCVRTGERPRSDGYSGLRVVRVLEALHASLDANGAAIEVGTTSRSAV